MLLSIGYSMISHVSQWSIIFLAVFTGFGLAFYSTLPAMDGVYATPSALLWAVVGEYTLPESSADSSPFVPSVRRCAARAPSNLSGHGVATVHSRVRAAAAAAGGARTFDCARLRVRGRYYSGPTRSSPRSSSSTC